MSTISRPSPSYLHATQRRPPSEKTRLSSAIGSEVSAGTLASADVTALDAIDSSLTADRSADATPARVVQQLQSARASNAG
ncbi:hypothetical protein ACFQ12_24020, partial [Methylobacterium trifolii]